MFWANGPKNFGVVSNRPSAGLWPIHQHSVGDQAAHPRELNDVVGTCSAGSTRQRWQHKAAQGSAAGGRMSEVVVSEF